MGIKSKSSPVRVEAEMMKMKAVQLRLAGYSLDEIGRQIGRSAGMVSRYISKALAEFAHETEEAVREMKMIEDARIERMIRSVWPQAVQGKLGAVDRVVRLMERKARLHGLDAPSRSELTGKDGGPVEVEGGGLASLLNMAKHGGDDK